MFVNIHERILKENGERWLAPNPFVPIITPAVRNHAQSVVARRDAAHADWGFKDPRACLFVDLWRTILSDPRFLVCLRHYTACIDSLVRRALESVRTTAERPLSQIHMRLAADEDRVARSWIAHMLPLVRLIRQNRDIVHVVTVGNLEPTDSITADLNARFGFRLDERPLADTFDDNLFRADAQARSRLSPETKAIAETVWQALTEAATPAASSAPARPLAHAV
ncbi:hypothetical protein [Acuticoccus mangrovi]|uniref:Sulfotransferase family protein n=1 Tax=Acuticoccus mangrovi TaxID=2796142 RepID=A0A934ILT0_9HYPH|nr:hypothetical protein [Acuticoccus mangrovi]MBJ3774698.1 hypothetical protein [Acuticoccus mangrovi]